MIWAIACTLWIAVVSVFKVNSTASWVTEWIVVLAAIFVTILSILQETGVI